MRLSMKNRVIPSIPHYVVGLFQPIHLSTQYIRLFDVESCWQDYAPSFLINFTDLEVNYLWTKCPLFLAKPFLWSKITLPKDQKRTSMVVIELFQQKHVLPFISFDTRKQHMHILCNYIIFVILLTLICSIPYAHSKCCCINLAHGNRGFW